MPRKISNREIRALDALIKEFDNPNDWRKSAKGNLCREWRGYRITLFRRFGEWRFVHTNDADGESVYSPQGYELIEDAKVETFKSIEGL